MGVGECDTAAQQEMRTELNVALVKVGGSAM